MVSALIMELRPARVHRYFAISTKPGRTSMLAAHLCNSIQYRARLSRHTLNCAITPKEPL
jgi:hypothetical protein